MSVTRNVLRGVLRSVTRPVIRAGVISRFFTPLDSSASQYYAFDQDVVLTGDYKITFSSTVSASAGTHNIVLGSDFDAGLYITLRSNGQIILQSGAIQVATAIGVLVIGSLNETSIKRVGDIISITNNNVDVASQSEPGLGTLLFNQTGSGAASFGFDGIIANINISGDGIQPIKLNLDENFGVTSIGVNSAPGNIGTYGNVTAQNISTDSPFYTLNATGTVWTSPDGPDLEVAT